MCIRDSVLAVKPNNKVVGMAQIPDTICLVVSQLKASIFRTIEIH